jgi:multiple antibiotic resistance protein
MLLLLNPFLLILYLLDLIRKLDHPTFSKVLCRAACISFVVFIIFSAAGDVLFEQILQAKFASFQVFGGIVFLLIGIRFVFYGEDAVNDLRGDPDHIAGSVAMPIMIGPGTVSASVIAGKRLGAGIGALSIFIAVSLSILVILGLKKLHDYIQPRNEALVRRYVEIAGRVAALVVGTFSVEMIFQGIRAWFGL